MFRRERKPAFLPWVALSVVLLLLVTLVLVYSGKTTETLRFAEAGKVWWASVPQIIADKRDLYGKEGLEIEKFDVNTGLASKNAVIQGNADVGVVSSTPLAIGATKKEPIVVLGSYMGAQHLLAIISRKTGSTPSIPGLAEPVGYVKGTISEFYFIEYLKKSGYVDKFKNNDITLAALRPAGIVPAFSAGSISTAVIWEPRRISNH